MRKKEKSKDYGQKFDQVKKNLNLQAAETQRFQQNNYRFPQQGESYKHMHYFSILSGHLTGSAKSG